VVCPDVRCDPPQDGRGQGRRLGLRRRLGGPGAGMARAPHAGRAQGYRRRPGKGVAAAPDHRLGDRRPGHGLCGQPEVRPGLVYPERPARHPAVHGCIPARRHAGQAAPGLRDADPGRQGEGVRIRQGGLLYLLGGREGPPDRVSGPGQGGGGRCNGIPDLCRRAVGCLQQAAPGAPSLVFG